jgi:hypothetical protein
MCIERTKQAREEKDADKKGDDYVLQWIYRLYLWHHNLWLVHYLIKQSYKFTTCAFLIDKIRTGSVLYGTK